MTEDPKLETQNAAAPAEAQAGKAARRGAKGLCASGVIEAVFHLALALFCAHLFVRLLLDTVNYYQIAGISERCRYDPLFEISKLVSGVLTLALLLFCAIGCPILVVRNILSGYTTRPLSLDSSALGKRLSFSRTVGTVIAIGHSLALTAVLLSDCFRRPMDYAGYDYINAEMLRIALLCFSACCLPMLLLTVAWRLLPLNPKHITALDAGSESSSDSAVKRRLIASTVVTVISLAVAVVGILLLLPQIEEVVMFLRLYIFYPPLYLSYFRTRAIQKARGRA